MQTEVEEQKKRRLSLRVQVISAMAIVLSPLLIMGAMQAWSARQHDEDIRYLELQQNAQNRLRDAEGTLTRARTALTLVATASRELSCREIGQRLSDLDLVAYNALRFDADGKVSCHQLGESLAGTPMPRMEWHDSMRKGQSTVEVSGPMDLALGEPAFHMMRRLTDDKGDFTGSVGLTLSMDGLASRLASRSEGSGAATALILPGGQIIGSNIVGSVPAEWLTPAAIMDRQLRRLVPEQGPVLDAAILPLSVDNTWLMAVETSPPQRFEVLFAFLVPILAYLAALLAASWIADAMVLRWLERIRVRMSDMRSSGQYAPLEPVVSRAPAEMQQLAEAFDELTQRVSRHESDLQLALNQMRAAFRETHHRVKNNLQVMLSMLKLQGRGEALPETQNALKVAARRAAMMAAVHHTLLNDTALETVEATDLFNAISNQINEQQGWVDSNRHIMPDIAPGPLPADYAVPLGMFVLEAIGLLCPEAGQADIADVELKFLRDNGTARLQLHCGRSGTSDDEEMGRDTNLFLSAFARQMSGSVAVDTATKGRVGIELSFAIGEIDEVT